jgi:hypothetical protein
MLILRESSISEQREGWTGNSVTVSRPVAPPGVTTASGRRSRQDWLAEAMQCLCYENMSMRSQD